MITLTPPAAKQIRLAAEQGSMEHLVLRLAAKKNPDGSIEYGMGFDEPKDDDLSYNCEGLEVVCEPQYELLLKGAVLDFVEMNPGEYRFIFLNPNDPNYVPPKENSGSCGSGGGGS